ncbi:response regulator receiver domain-containing protein [Mucilaginibacter oryzae]|uniref:Response regulator receiver domain-containing protein n=1 Tax=Mucilaginibacter oryzae TaxID=468058 RepID=A0A316H8B9_9SPHI|nr:response regulator [Mucilaginibacter oryzae]PWK77234.1 response regulator receiver domain-containing protein [Mucilaginibacter oryzae]
MKRILVIDDDEDLLDIFSILFRDAGYNVITSNHSETANEILEIGPDLVILDIRISGSPQSGEDICRNIKQKFKSARIPVLLISAETDISEIAFRCGADGFVTKPFDIPSLLMEIRKFLK